MKAVVVKQLAVATAHAYGKVRVPVVQQRLHILQAALLLLFLVDGRARRVSLCHW